MDRLIYTAMSGAGSLLQQQAVVANNLANADTAGFRADTAVFRAVPVQGAGMPTRTSVLNSTPGTDFSSGPIIQTGRALDIAVRGKGWIAVQSSDGSEAYTRAGSLMVGPDGTLQTQTGLPVLSSTGPIAVPPNTSVSVGADGTVSGIPTQPPFAVVSTLGVIKLVNPPEQDLVKGPDGLIRQKDGTDADADPTVSVINGSTEGSNVNPAEAMVSMISLAREFEMHMKMIQSAQDNGQSADQLLSTN